MKIAYLTSQYARAGDTFIRSEVEALRKRGHEVETFSIRRAQDEKVSDEVRAEQDATDYIVERGMGRLAASLVKMGVTRPARTLDALRTAWKIRPPGNLAAAKQLAYLAEAAYLAERLNALGVQHLHNHIPENSGTVAMLASIISGVPHSHTVHGPRFFYSPEKWGLDEKLSRSAFIACITSFCRSQCMVFTDPEHWDKLQEVHCGLDAKFLDSPVEPVPPAPRLVAVGRLCPEKGFVLLVEAVRRLKDEGTPIEVQIVGGGPSQSELEARIAALDVEDEVRLLGWRTSDQVRDLIKGARALINPSFAEGLPVVIMESFALARPVISTYIAGVPELVEPGVSGWLVPAGAVDPLVTAMREAVTAPTARLDEMGGIGRDRVRQQHDIINEVAKLERLIAESTGA